MISQKQSSKRVEPRTTYQYIYMIVKIAWNMLLGVLTLMFAAGWVIGEMIGHEKLAGASCALFAVAALLSIWEDLSLLKHHEVTTEFNDGIVRIKSSHRLPGDT